ncbi:unnamed protein product, partial [Prorocentrum cordatum]
DSDALALNSRANALCAACGLPPKSLRGPCFLSRTEEFMPDGNENPSWRRCDFRLADCRSDAAWVQELREGRERSGARADEDRKWFESLEDGDEQLPSGGNKDYSWSQTDDEVEVTFSPAAFRGIRATKRDVTVRISARSLFVRLRGRVLASGPLHAEVDPLESTWTYSQGSYELQVTLAKVSPALRAVSSS